MIGSILDGKYRIVRELGAGAMGAVYEGANTATGRRVAIKVITNALAQNQDLINRFKHEALAAGRIETKHITQVLDAGVDRETGSPFIVMEFLSGRDVADLIKRLGPLAPDLALRITAQACLGLQKAHETGVVHRDIKPANLFLAESDGEVIVKVLDFGIAKVQMEQAQETESAGLTRTGSLLGSPLYMSPEQAQGLKGIDARADIWSLGATLYQCLCGRTPYHEYTALGQLIVAISSKVAPSVQYFAPWVPPEVAAIVHGCLRHDPNQRFQSAKDLLTAIRQLLPHGWSIQANMLVSLSESSRAVTVAPYELPSMRPPPEVTPSASVPPPGNVAATQVLSSHPGAGSNPNVTSQSGSQVLVQSQVAPPRRSNSVMPIIGGVGMFAAIAIAAVVLGMSRGNQPEPLPAPQPAPTLSASVAVEPSPIPPPAPPVTKEPEKKKHRIAIEPLAAAVEIDGNPAEAFKGEVTLEGAVGDTFKVRLKLYGKTKDYKVIIGNDGPEPFILKWFEGSTENAKVKSKVPPGTYSRFE